ncbi:MAG: hypothetical protein LBF93_07685 [Zoogloeaceae bacterium]|jgi:hypothetical protein|nr:hypothetical protein [Zoogloeaceae bacterium]
MKKLITCCLAVFLWALSTGVPVWADTLEKVEEWVNWRQKDAAADGCAYYELLSGSAFGYGGLFRFWNEDEAVSLFAQSPPRYLDFLDASLKTCSLPAGKNLPDPDASENKWLEHFDSYRHSDYDAHFNQAAALALAGPAVKDGVTCYWQQNGKTHIRFALKSAGDLRSWAKRRGISLQLTRQPSNGPVYNHDMPTLRAKTAIPVFVVSPEGLTPARIVDFAVGGSSWLEVVLANDTTPPIWAVIALRDPALARKAKVTRQRELETQKEGTHYLELKRGVLRLEFKNDALPPLILVARQLGFKERSAEIDEAGNWVGNTEEEILLGSAWGTEILISDETYGGKNHWNPSAVFGRPISFLGSGSPPCPPPAPE